jgi:hypothetical protein
MTEHSVFDKIDIDLIRILNTVLIERSVSSAVLRLGVHQLARPRMFYPGSNRRKTP